MADGRFIVASVDLRFIQQATMREMHLKNIHTGKDQNGRDVSRDNLMGYGSGLRQFYFDLWNNWSM